ncbi:hypothetical protein [Aureimonas sp. AU20]|uniref:hypothetical protein n=1 Tax=Aureimonas sp. AU20 TaxID=1349819 RepID=UPI0007222007|nr:hypothetical protein [Aureimonas sp. AU20]ALN75824.1 hypothetical protein M673_24025 [Aureimonas sp. AU20]
MFEVGKRYEFRMIEGGDEVVSWGEVEAYEHPVLKLRDSPEREIPAHLMPRRPLGQGADRGPGTVPRRPGQIINVTSPNFISAVEKIG